MSERTSEEAKRLARVWIETWNGGDPYSLPLAEDFVHESPFGRIEGREKYLGIVGPMATENVARLEVQEVIGEGSRACIRFTMATDSGVVPCCDWVTVVDGRIASVSSYYDTRDLPHFEKY